MEFGTIEREIHIEATPEVVYQVVDPPAGAVVPTLPAGCTSVNKGGTAYSQCGTTYYQKVSNGYQVATPK